MKKILVVDDEEWIREILKQALRTYHVLQAVDGEEAIKIIGSHQPHLVITDLRMPSISGEELIRFIKKDPHTNIKIIALSGEDWREPVARSAGCDAFFLKPFDLFALREEVKRLLGEE